MSSPKKVVVAGASGLIGLAAVRHFGALPDWDVVGLSRRTPPALPGVRYVAVDLADPQSVAAAAPELAGATHFVYAALYEIPGLMPGWYDDEVIERNGAMLRNVFDVLEPLSPGLEHVSLLHGTKAYGVHHPSLQSQQVRLPLREREPRREHRNFYFLQEDYLRAKQAAGATWGLTVFRPTVVYGDAVGNNMNPIPAIAAYATLLREEGSPLHYPGRSLGPVVREAVDADLIAHALAWAATSPEAAGGTYNLTNGDVFMWEHMWPAIAETLGMPTGEHRPMSLTEELPKREAEWAAIVDKYHLTSPRSLIDFVGYNSLVYTDNLLANVAPSGPTMLNSTIAARQAGFADCMDTEDMFRKWFEQLQTDGALPPKPSR